MMITFNVNLLRLTSLGMCNILYYYFAIRIHLNAYLMFGYINLSRVMGVLRNIPKGLLSTWKFLPKDFYFTYLRKLIKN